MNKKNLSVVLAGAMLATSVAPVLADTTATEYSLDNIELLKNEVKSKMETKMLSSNEMLKNETTFLEKEVRDLLVDKASAFGVRVSDEKGNKIDETYILDNVDAVLAKAKAGYTVEIIERETSEFYGEIIPGEKIVKGEKTVEYDPADDFAAGAITSKGQATYDEIKFGDTANLLVDSLSAKDDVLTVTLNKLKNPANAADGTETISLTGNSKKIDGRLPLTADEKLLNTTKSDDIPKFDHFDTLTTWTASKASKKEATVVTSYKMTAESADENTIKASDLYDGVALTAKGTEIANDIANAKENVVTKDKELVKIDNMPKDPTNGGTAAPIYKFTVKYYKNESLIPGTPYKTITVYSSNYKELNSLHGMLSGNASYSVGIVAGDNRYSTAVNVAKAQKAKIDLKTGLKNIVLVNGSSLVDGLSAAPLAAIVNGNDKDAAPVLLSKTDSLPEETKEYIESLTSTLTAAQKKQVTINFVGGKSVLSEDLVSELEDMGFYVKRLGGSNREATSLAVAKEIATKTTKDNNVFVVGGNGEADAMAISAVAASDLDSKTAKKQVAPIIVSSVHGISSDALEFLNEKSAKADVTIVGGTSVVSEEEEKAINDSLTLNKAIRISGENRFETNAAIIKEYYGANKVIATSGVENVILAKDGQAKKGDLVDALAAANFAATNNAPIVLATNSLNAAQKNELLKVKKATATQLVQVGQGVERSVLEAVAGLLGLSNK